MKKMTKKIINLLSIIFCCIILNSQSISAQEIKSFKKNSIYVSYGNIIFSSQASISYERLLLQKNNNRTNGKLTYGNYLNNDFDYDVNATIFENYFGVSIVQLIGLLELNGGLAYAKYKLAPGFDPDIDYTQSKKKFVFYGNIGIRYVKDGLMIKAGLGNLELLHIGIGINL